jgi:hypothetical protein
MGLDLALGTYIFDQSTDSIGSVSITTAIDDRQKLVEYSAKDCLAVSKLAIVIHEQWSRQQLEHYIHRHNASNHPDNTHDQDYQSIDHQVVNVNEHPNRLNVIDYPQIENEFEQISDDEIPTHSIRTERIVTVVSQPAPSDIVQLDIEQLPLTDNKAKKKRSQEAKNRRGRRRNAILRAHRHDFDIVRPVYYRFRVQQIEKILQALHVRYRHCIIRSNYQLHIGVHSKDDQIHYQYLFGVHYFTKQHYEQLFGLTETHHHSSTSSRTH